MNLKRSLKQIKKKKRYLFMATEKMTKKDYFNQLLAIPEVAEKNDLVDFINHQIELLDNRNKKKDGTITKTQLEHRELMDRILDLMECDTGYTCGDLHKFLNDSNISANKVSAMLKKLVDSGEIEKTTEKRKSIFTKRSKEE